MSGTIVVTTLKDGASATNNLTLDPSGNATVANTLSMGSSFLRNRILNGAMQIDQRNAGAVATLSDGGYSLDRWKTFLTQAGKYSLQQNAGGVSTPAGFSNYLGVTSLSAYSSLATDYFFVGQPIEGFNFYDLAWGTASAKTVTLSFQIYSSLTGTFSGALVNSAQNRSYPFTYTVSSANTWTQISVTIPGDTSGTWIGATNGIGVNLRFNLGSGSNFLGTSGAWAAANYIGSTGSVSVVGTSGATFYITGVQLEVGTVATPFERRLYGQELALCQRYAQVYTSAGIGLTATASSCGGGFVFPVQMRTSPTISGGSFAVGIGSAGTFTTAFPTQYSMILYNSAANWTLGTGVNATFTASAEL